MKAHKIMTKAVLICTPRAVWVSNLVSDIFKTFLNSRILDKRHVSQFRFLFFQSGHFELKCYPAILTCGKKILLRVVFSYQKSGRKKTSAFNRVIYHHEVFSVKIMASLLFQ